MKVGIVGSRRRIDKEAIEAFVDTLPITDIVVSGGCKGVDLWAENRAKQRGMQTKIFLPRIEGIRNKYHLINAYYKRNQKIAEECDTLVAFPAADRKGGTEYTIKVATKLGKQVIIFPQDD